MQRRSHARLELDGGGAALAGPVRGAPPKAKLPTHGVCKRHGTNPPKPHQAQARCRSANGNTRNSGKRNAATVAVPRDVQARSAQSGAVGIGEAASATIALEASVHRKGGSASRWKSEEVERLLHGTRIVDECHSHLPYDKDKWAHVAVHVGTRNARQCRRMWLAHFSRPATAATQLSAAWPRPARPHRRRALKRDQASAADDPFLGGDEPIFTVPMFITHTTHDPIYDHYGLLAIEAYDEGNDRQKVAKRTRLVVGKNFRGSFSFDAQPALAKSAMSRARRLQEEGVIREHQAEITDYMLRVYRNP